MRAATRRLIPLLLGPAALQKLNARLSLRQAAFWIAAQNHPDNYLDPAEQEILTKYFDAPPGQQTAPRLLDLFCGAGREARLLASQGWHVLGLDSAGPIIQHNRQTQARLPGGAAIEYQAGVLPAALKTIHAPWEAIVICHGMYSTIAGQRQRRQLMETLATLTTPGGRILISALTRIERQRYTPTRRKLLSLIGGNSAIQSGDVFLAEFLHYFADEQDILAEIELPVLKMLDHCKQPLPGGDTRHYFVLEKANA
ncbi:MAG: class I SAM-dependent methyltransferase [Leptospiraceae bacterium]|nr:class I SAM-dependent methyltransferase [Leptospiraceae bacterium]